MFVDKYSLESIVMVIVSDDEDDEGAGGDGDDDGDGGPVHTPQQAEKEQPMAEWSAAQVCEWVTQIDLPPGCAETVGRIFAECDFDGPKANPIPRQKAGQGQARRQPAAAAASPRARARHPSRAQDARR